MESDGIRSESDRILWVPIGSNCRIDRPGLVKYSIYIFFQSAGHCEVKSYLSIISLIQYN